MDGIIKVISLKESRISFIHNCKGAAESNQSMRYINNEIIEAIKSTLR